MYPLYFGLSCAKSHTVGTVKPRFIYLIAGTSDDWNRGFDISNPVPARPGRLIPDTNQISIHTQKRGTSRLGLAKVSWYPLYRLNGAPRSQFELPYGHSVDIGGRRVCRDHPESCAHLQVQVLCTGPGIGVHTSDLGIAAPALFSQAASGRPTPCARRSRASDQPRVRWSPAGPDRGARCWCPRRAPRTCSRRSAGSALRDQSRSRW